MLEAIYFSEGRLTKNGTNPYQFEYTIKDHLGNARVSFSDLNGNNTVDVPVEVLQDEGYYPFGLQQSPLGAVTGTQNKYQYNGKEFNDDLGLNELDYGARFYQPEIGRWGCVDPLTEKAPSWTPHRAFFNNPIKYFDPNGKWEKDANGNLVAEKKDNAYSLAKYLNTDSKTAISMLGEQGYTVNKKGILNLKVGDVFKVENTTPAPESREDLGYMGNQVRKRAGSEFSKNLFENYWKGEGDVELSGKRFAGILMYVKENSPNAGKPSNVVLVNSDGTTEEGSKRVVSFYTSYEYNKAFGSATLYYNKEGNITGFYDFYDFDSKPWGQRSTKNEIITRMVETVSPDSVKPFSIRYGDSKR